jgi:hypothetical protein
MDPLKLEEYAALRATIRERGTTRVWLAWAGIVGWATLVSALASFGVRPLLLLAPLAVLAITFEGVFALHTGVERIGRYIRVMFEEQEAGTSMRWETAAMRFGRLFPARGSDPLFTWLFIAATLIDLTPTSVAGPRPTIELAIVALAHALLIVRIILARRSAAGQRARDLDRYRALAREHNEGLDGRPHRAAPTM